MNKGLFLDTNILIYLLEGDKDIQEIVGDRKWYISVISEIELLIKPGISKQDEKAIQLLLKECIIVELNKTIKDLSIQYGREYKLKVADSVILASSLVYKLEFITADKTFKRIPESESKVLMYDL